MQQSIGDCVNCYRNPSPRRGRFEAVALRPIFAKEFEAGAS